MKLSEYTLTVLKNFASINSGVVIRPGSLQQTISPEESILVKAELTDVFPSQFGIYDLNQFLGNVTTLNNPELTFTDKIVTLDDGAVQMVYFSCRPELIKSPPDKPFDLKNPDVTFDLTHAALSKILKLGSMNSLSHLSFTGAGNEIRMKVHDRKSDSSNFAATMISENTYKEDFSESFVTDSLKMLQDDYTVEMKLGAFAKFTGKKTNIKYFIAFEKKNK